MAEENKSAEGGNEPQFTEIELKAIDQGWRPKDEWDGDPAEWRSAKEFVDRGELFKKIEDQNRTIKEFKKTLDDFARHHAKVREAEYKRAVEELKQQKKEALIEGDADAVVNIDEKLDLVREAQRVAPPPVQAPAEVNPVFQAWKERNSWYDSNRAMRGAADTIGNDLAERGMSPADILVEVERQIRKEFAHKFENPNRQRASAVEGTGPKGTSKKDDFVLTDEERRAMRRFVDQKVMTEAEYIAELKRVKEIR